MYTLSYLVSCPTHNYASAGDWGAEQVGVGCGVVYTWVREGHAGLSQVDRVLGVGAWLGSSCRQPRKGGCLEEHSLS